MAYEYDEENKVCRVVPANDMEMSTVERSRKRFDRTGRVDWGKLKATADKDIQRQIDQDPDTAPEVTKDDLDRADIVSPDGTRMPYRDRMSRVKARA